MALRDICLFNLSGMIKGFTVAPANVDERAVAPDITDHIHGLLGADRRVYQSRV